MGMDGQRTTAGQIADNLGIKPDTMSRTVRRKLGTGIGLNIPLSADQVSVLLGKRTTAPEVERPELKEPPIPRREIKLSTKKQVAKWPWRSISFIALMLVPTAASVQNMHDITYQIGHSEIKAILLTIMLSFSALGFTALGLRGWHTVTLAAVLIIYEAFCNTTAIYDGLMGGISGNPTRFCGVVTDIFNCGSYGAALTLGASIGLMIAAVQFTALYHLKKAI
jgi:hypothetical protein